MKKITLEIIVPASGNKYEMRFPRDIKISDAEKMINDYLRLRSDERGTHPVQQVLQPA